MVRFLLTIILSSTFFMMPVDGQAVEELHQIPSKAETSGMYERAVEFFVKKIPETFRERLANSMNYIDMIKAIFTQKGVPAELAYLPLIESGFSPLSVGRGDAVGLWQFVRTTAERYGLRVDDYVDERKDPLKSTVAAAEHLRYLYSIFGAWDTALAAYNAGEGRIKGVSNIYSSRSVPAITKRYVPYFMAAFTVATNPERYGFALAEEVDSAVLAYREIITRSAVSLRALARTHRTTVQELARLNPALLTDMTPPYPYAIRVPLNYQ